MAIKKNSNLKLKSYQRPNPGSNLSLFLDQAHNHHLCKSDPLDSKAWKVKKVTVIQQSFIRQQSQLCHLLTFVVVANQKSLWILLPSNALCFLFHFKRVQCSKKMNHQLLSYLTHNRLPTLQGSQTTATLTELSSSTSMQKSPRSSDVSNWRLMTLTRWPPSEMLKVEFWSNFKTLSPDFLQLGNPIGTSGDVCPMFNMFSSNDSNLKLAAFRPFRSCWQSADFGSKRPSQHFFTGGKDVTVVHNVVKLLGVVIFAKAISADVSDFARHLNSVLIITSTPSSPPSEWTTHLSAYRTHLS